MTTQADRQRAKLAQRRTAESVSTTDRDAPREDDDPTARPERVSTVRTEPYRRSIDFPPARHFDLEDWITESSRMLGYQITGRAVVNVLVQRLLTDESLARQVRTDPELREISEWRAKGRPRK